MSENDELILGFIPLPQVHETPTESNGARASSPLSGREGEAMTGDDTADCKPAQNQDEVEDVEYKPELNTQNLIEFKPELNAQNLIEFKPEINSQNLVEFKIVKDEPRSQDDVEFKHVIEEHRNQETVEYKIIVKEETITQETDEHEDTCDLNNVHEGINVETGITSNSTAVVDGTSEPVKVSANLVDFINQAGAELMAGTMEEEEPLDSQPAKKRRKTLPKGTFQCAECRTFCEDFVSYSSHMNTHSDVPLYTCQKCLYIFQDKSQYDLHTAQTCKAAGNAKDKECAVCKKTFKYDSHLREHIICMHNKTPLFSCPICHQNITSWRRSIDRHMANHANNNKCPTCGVKGENAQAIEAHVLQTCNLQCKTCEYSTKIRQDFFNHVTVHIPKTDVLEPMVCFKCQHRFQRTSEFNNHVRLFCEFREVEQVEATKVIESSQSSSSQSSIQQPTIHLPIAEGISGLQVGHPEMLAIANDPSKQIFTLPEGVNNNTFIPITVSTGTDEHGQSLGTTVILIPQILLMPNGGLNLGLTLDGTTQVIGDGQNDQVIYLECIKPEQQGMMPMLEVPTDKGVQEGTFVNHMPQTVVQTIQTVHEAQPMSTVQPLQTTAQPIQTILPLQAVQPVQSFQASEQPIMETIKIKSEDIKEEVEEDGEHEASPTSIQASIAPPISVQNVFSMASSTAPNTSSVDSVIQHVIDQTGPPALVCSVCKEVLKDSESFETHVKQHEKKPKVPKPNLVVQKKGSNGFNCDQCGQGFAAKHHLEQHTITFHSDVAGIVCPVCRVGMASEKMSLNEHLAKAHKLRVEPSGKLTECSES